MVLVHLVDIKKDCLISYELTVQVLYDIATHLIQPYVQVLLPWDRNLSIFEEISQLNYCWEQGIFFVGNKWKREYLLKGLIDD